MMIYWRLHQILNNLTELDDDNDNSIDDEVIIFFKLTMHKYGLNLYALIHVHSYIYICICKYSCYFK